MRKWCIMRINGVSQVGKKIKKIIIKKKSSPDCDVVVYGLGAQHGEVDVDAVAGRHSDAPHAVLEVGVFLRVTRRVNGPV